MVRLLVLFLFVQFVGDWLTVVKRIEYHCIWSVWMMQAMKRGYYKNSKRKNIIKEFSMYLCILCYFT